MFPFASPQGSKAVAASLIIESRGTNTALETQIIANDAILKAANQGYAIGRTNRGRSSGKYYFEAKKTAGPENSSSGVIIGVCAAGQDLGDDNGSGAAILGYSAGAGYQCWSGTIRTDNVDRHIGSTWANNNIYNVGCAVDFALNKVWFSRSGVWQNGGNPDLGTGGFPLAAGTMFAALGLFRGFSPSDRIYFLQEADALYKPSTFLYW
jgi:hypothetical protein